MDLAGGRLRGLGEGEREGGGRGGGEVDLGFFLIEMEVGEELGEWKCKGERGGEVGQGEEREKGGGEGGAEMR